jgi:hypothetical protein
MATIPSRAECGKSFACADAGPSLAELLERAGCVLRGRSRADCPKCEGQGHSRATIALTDQTFFCHRCGWKGNTRSLSRQLNIRVAPETADARAARELAQRFDDWRDTCQRILTDKHRELGRDAALAQRVLADTDEMGWAILKQFYDEEGQLAAALDVLTFEKCSPWLDEPMTRERLQAAFEEAVTKGGQLDATRS